MNTFPDYSIWEIRQKTHYVKDPVEARNELIDTFRTFHMLYGRHFLNMYHKMLKDSLDEQRKEFPKPPMEGILDNIDLSFLAVNPVATVEDNLRNILQLERKSQWYLRSVFVYIFNTANVLFARKDFYVKMIGNVQERQDWYQWSEELENRCRMLNKKFPGFFSARLEDFYRSTTREIKRTAQYNVQEETKGYTDNMEEKGMFRVKEFGCGPPFYKIAPGENISKKKSKPWNWVIGKIEAYKNNPFCGYFYSILEHWLNKMELSMKIVLTEVESKYWPDNMRTEEWTKKRTLEFYNLKVEKAESSAQREKWLSIYGGRPLPSFSDAFTNYIRKGVYGPVTMWREHVTNENSAQPEKHVMKQS